MEDGSFDLTTNVERITRACMRHGFSPNGQFQTVCGLALFEKEYFCPMDLFGHVEKTKNTHTIHWFNGSWLPEETRRRLAALRKREKRDRLRHTPNRALKKLLGDGGYEKLKSIFKK